MKRLLFNSIFFILAITSIPVFASDIPSIQGTWVAGSEAFNGYDFSIKNGRISFIDQHCQNNKFEVVEKFDGVIKSWDGKVGDYYTYILRIHYSNSPKCANMKYVIGEYIRINIPKDSLCSSSTFFYQGQKELDKDKRNKWDGNYFSGWGWYGKRNCKEAPNQ